MQEINEATERAKNLASLASPMVAVQDELDMTLSEAQAAGSSLATPAGRLPTSAHDATGKQHQRNMSDVPPDPIVDL